jgi:hypothetical protein
MIYKTLHSRTDNTMAKRKMTNNDLQNTTQTIELIVTVISQRYSIVIRPNKKICVFTVTCQKNLGSVGFLLATLSIFTQNLDKHFCCLISSNVLFIQPLVFVEIESKECRKTA